MKMTCAWCKKEIGPNDRMWPAVDCCFDCGNVVDKSRERAEKAEARVAQLEALVSKNPDWSDCAKLQDRAEEWKREVERRDEMIAAADHREKEARGRVAELEATLSNAHSLAAEGWSYASGYFREKWEADRRMNEIALVLVGATASVGTVDPGQTKDTDNEDCRSQGVRRISDADESGMASRMGKVVGGDASAVEPPGARDDELCLPYDPVKQRTAEAEVDVVCTCFMVSAWEDPCPKHGTIPGTVAHRNAQGSNDASPWASLSDQERIRFAAPFRKDVETLLARHNVESISCGRDVAMLVAHHIHMYRPDNPRKEPRGIDGLTAHEREVQGLQNAIRSVQYENFKLRVIEDKARAIEADVFHSTRFGSSGLPEWVRVPKDQLHALRAAIEAIGPGLDQATRAHVDAEAHRSETPVVRVGDLVYVGASEQNRFRVTSIESRAWLSWVGAKDEMPQEESVSVASLRPVKP